MQLGPRLFPIHRPDYLYLQFYRPAPPLGEEGDRLKHHACRTFGKWWDYLGRAALPGGFWVDVSSGKNKELAIDSCIQDDDNSLARTFTLGSHLGTLTISRSLWSGMSHPLSGFAGSNSQSARIAATKVRISLSA